MASEKFTFKQFEVWHDKCGMKVGFDGVLLGAWADTSGCHTMIDIGTGTGLIALIAAQRNPELHITAIDIMPNAVEQARENVLRSPFASRIDVVEGDFLDMDTADKGEHPSLLFDAIISNPPFYAADVHSPSAERDTARHSSSLPLSKLVAHASRMLAPTGCISLILPFTVATEAIGLAYMNGLQLSRRTDVYNNAHSAPKRSLLEFRKVDLVCPCVKDRLFIRGDNNEYTDCYRSLTEDLYIKL